MFTVPEGAPCTTRDPELWFGTAAQQRQAKAACLTCPAVGACRADARATETTRGEVHGTRGGLTQTERRKATAPAPRRMKPKPASTGAQTAQEATR